MGKSGSGKSLVLQTLLNTYGTTKHDMIQEGHILFNDQTPSSNQIIWRHKFDIVDQGSQFFPTSIHDNIAIGSKFSKSIHSNQVEKICKLVNIQNTILSLHKGYDNI